MHSVKGLDPSVGGMMERYTSSLCCLIRFPHNIVIKHTCISKTLITKFWILQHIMYKQHVFTARLVIRNILGNKNNVLKLLVIHEYNDP